MKNWLIASSVMALLSCAREPTVLVTVEGVPSTAQSLQVIATHAGFAESKDIDPYNLTAPVATTSTFLLRLPSGFNGDLRVSVAAFDKPDGQGCLIASGGSLPDVDMFVGPDDARRVPLTAVTDTAACSGKRPLLLSAMPGLGNTTGGETVTFTGWGFKPDGAVTMGSKDSQFKFVTSGLLQVTTPAKAGFGAVNLRFANKDGTFDLRKDLFRFYTNTLSFTTFPLNNTTTFNDNSGFAVGLFDPATTVDLAIALPAPRNFVRVEFTLNGNVLSNRETDIPVGNNPGPVDIADFDKDGDMDIVVANIDDGTIQIIKNDGAGNFVAGPAISAGGANSFPVALVAGDLNGDGLPDVVVTNKLAGQAGRIRVFLNTGGGALMETVDSPFKVGNEPVSVALGDINGDKQLDIAVANQLEDTPGSGNYRVHVLLNNGAGVYQDSGGTFLSLPVCKMPTSVKIADTDLNGQQDLLISCTGDNRVHVALNNGFPNISEYDITTEAMPRNLTLTDVNGDGIIDLIVPSQGANTVDIFLNKQGAGFQGVNYVSKDVRCNAPYVTAVLDVDGDGKSDLGVAGLGSSAGCISILFNQSL